ncbi:MAG: 5'-methylthioadenosine phosphorylase [Gammaproteobacteria bacterium]|jgi:5'-deoxy-5'-methylthioadenosine phosphorylase|nr:5'-methylthioadenosine phosphorylase [Gammaproteobacteria bacterium]HJN96394.1 S-methyl-5'-thioinosine phosphorylase [Gammaproteobacteria bacterium]|tara:strand:- start:26620 stop:27378 length:759 start_codon:yes stop_codon:yes gene_type:complete
MLAVIGGTGLAEVNGFESAGRKRLNTPYAEKRVWVELLQYRNNTLAFLPRHGKNHVIPPHKVNYRANLWALHKLGVTQIVAVNAVGGIHENLAPGSFAIPDQIIDYTYGRSTTYFEEDIESVTHIDFTYPFAKTLRRALLDSANAANKACPIMDGGVYGCMQGPRLETAAEVSKLKRDGCDLLGMTAMPEAALARELGMDYAMLALSVNWAAGLSDGEISMEDITAVVEEGMDFVVCVLQSLVQSQAGNSSR